MSKQHTYTVTELNHAVKDLLEASMGTVWLSGEITNCRKAASGHYYLAFKDARTQISAVIWRSTAARLQFEPQDGLGVLVRGDLKVYEQRGVYQIVVSGMQPEGFGVLQLAFEQMREKLAKEGLFDPARKRRIPVLPACIGLVTSPVGAAVEDMIRIIRRRFPGMPLVLKPVSVQGDGAAGEIAGAIHQMNQWGGADVLIVGRGGGSLEDLWPFNEEIVARAIADSRIPVISAVGHEIDVVIADLVADVRAATPSEAAELVTPIRRELAARLDSLAGQLTGMVRQRIAWEHERLHTLRRSWALMHPVERLHHAQQRLDELAEQLIRSMQHQCRLLRERLQGVAGKLDDLSPLAVLARGYSMTFDAQGRVIRNMNDVRPGQMIHTRLQNGRLLARVEEKA